MKQILSYFIFNDLENDANNYI